MHHLDLDLPHIRLHAVTAGAGPLVLLLHGFPEFWFSWRNQLPALADAGFRALAPDMRGYNRSAKPRGVRAYSADRLVADVAALIEHEAAGPVCLVGHDWGGIVAWRCAALVPHLVRKLVILNAPHPAHYQQTLRRNFSQWLRSSYVALFQMPGLAEFVLRVGDFALIHRGFRQQAPQAFSEDDIQQYKTALRIPGALTSALNYYRAAIWRSAPLLGEPQRCEVPTLLIWGERDPFLSNDLTRGLEKWVPDLIVQRLPNAGHWVQNESPEEVNRLLIEFLRNP